MKLLRIQQLISDTRCAHQETTHHEVANLVAALIAPVLKTAWHGACVAGATGAVCISAALWCSAAAAERNGPSCGRHRAG